MYNPTLTIAIFGSILVWLLRPSHALVAYIAALVWYPSTARVSIGTIDFSVGRIVVAALLLRCLCDDRIRKRFLWCQLDTWVALSMVVYVGMYCATRPFMQAFENRSGFLMDTFLSYLAVRFVVRDRTTLVSFVKGVSFAIAALAILSVIECVTYWQPFRSLGRFRPWAPTDGTGGPNLRWGFARAIGPFPHPILFGACFVMFLPLIWTLRHQRNLWGKLAYPLSAIATLGALTSLSSGSWVMLIAAIFFLVMERYKRWVKPLLIAALGSCIIVGVISNRPLHHVLYSYANPAGGVWYQRAELIDSAIEDFGEWWLAGYGGQDPGWGQRFSSRTDANNEFILKGMRYGLLGVIVLCAVLIAAFRGLLRAAKQTADVELKSLYWALGCVLAGVIVLWQGVSFFGQLQAIFYCILGIIGSSFVFAKSTETYGGKLLRTNVSNAILAHGQVR